MILIRRSSVRLLLASVVILLVANCSLKEKLPEMPKVSMPKVSMPKMPKLGKKSGDLPPHVGPPGSGSYLFYQQCSQCHGDPPASMFTELMEGVPTITDPRRVKSIDQKWLYRIISEGGSSVARRSTMPSFKDVLTEAEIRRIVSYLNGNPV